MFLPCHKCFSVQFKISLLKQRQTSYIWHVFEDWEVNDHVCTKEQIGELIMLSSEV